MGNDCISHTCWAYFLHGKGNEDTYVSIWTQLTKIIKERAKHEGCASTGKNRYELCYLLVKSLILLF
jgi:hypothetical protein